MTSGDENLRAQAYANLLRSKPHYSQVGLFPEKHGENCVPTKYPLVGGGNAKAQGHCRQTRFLKGSLKNLLQPASPLDGGLGRLLNPIFFSSPGLFTLIHSLTLHMSPQK